MSLRSLVERLPEIKDALAADPQGGILESTLSGPGVPRTAASAAAVVNQLGVAGASAGFTRLASFVVKAPGSTTVTAVRRDALLVATVDASRGTSGVVKALQAWSPEGGARPLPPALAVPAPAPASPVPAPHAPHPDPWAGLRRALVRGQLTEAAARQREIASAVPLAPARAGSEPLEHAELRRTMQLLLEGIGSVMAGDGVGGSRTLLTLAGPSQPNLSIRWLALHWSARAALKSGGFAAAGAHVKEALTLGRQLDIESRAVSQLAAAEVLAHDVDPTKALAWLRESRSRFERLSDRWGIAQTWLVEARIHGAALREEEAAASARHAWDADPDSDEPPIFLARRALVAGDLARAGEILRPVETPAAERVRALVEAIRGGAVSAHDGAEFLRLREGPPTAAALRALERITVAAPRFVQAREALAHLLLKTGRYAEARPLFRGLLSEPLAAADRASVMLGLGCIANALPEEGQELEAPRAPARGGAAAAAHDPAASAPALSRMSSSVLVGGAGPNAVFSGQLGDFAVPDLLEFLRSARRTGLLVCSSAGVMAAVRFRDGFVTGAAAPGTPDLGEALVRLRKVSALALAAVAKPDAAGEPDHVLGDALVREGLVDLAAVHEAQRLQIELAIRQLVQWKDGEFAFSRDAELEGRSAEGSVALDAQAVLLEVFRQMDEATRADAGAEASP